MPESDRPLYSGVASTTPSLLIISHGLDPMMRNSRVDPIAFSARIVAPAYIVVATLKIPNGMSTGMSFDDTFQPSIDRGHTSDWAAPMLPRIPSFDLLRLKLLVARLHGLGEIPGNRGSSWRLSVTKLQTTAQIPDGGLLGTELGLLTFGLPRLSYFLSLRFLSSLSPLSLRRHDRDV